MACSIPNLPDFLNLLKNRKNAYVVTPNDTVEDIENRLKHTQETVKLDVPTHKYSVEDFVFDKSVTEIVGKKFNKEFSESAKAVSDLGTMGHAVLEGLLNGQDMSDYSENGWKFTPNQYAELERVVSGIKQKAERLQKTIDPNAKVKYLTEQRVINAIKDRVGTADLVVLFSNGTAMVYDFKFRSIGKSFWDASGNLINTDPITARYQEYEMQLKLLAHDLKESYGVKEIVGGRVIPIAMNLNWFKDTDGSYKLANKKINSLVTPFTPDTILEQGLLLPEKTRNRAIDSFIHKSYQRINVLEKSKNPFERAEAERLRGEIYQIVEHHNFNILAKNISDRYNDLLERFDQPEFDESGKPNPLYYSQEDIDEFYSNIEAAEYMARESSEYMLRIKPDKTKAGFEERQKLYLENEKRIGEILINIGQIKTKLKALNATRIQQDLFEDEKVTNDSGIISERGVGFMTGTFFGLADQKQVEFRALDELRKKDDLAISNEIGNFIQDWAKMNDKLQKYINQVGRKAFIDSVFDEKSGNLITQINNTFFQDKKEAAKNKDVAWFRKYYEPRYTEEEYNKRLADATAKFNAMDNLSAEQKRAKIDWWIEQNNLFGAYTKAWTNSYKVKMKEITEDKYLTPEYLAIKNTPAGEFYRYYRDNMRVFLNMVGEYQKKSNMLPWIKQDMVEGVMNKGIANLPKAVKDSFLNAISVKNDRSVKEYDEYGELKNTVPIYFLNPQRNDKGEIIPGQDKSMDFMKSLLMFGQMAISHKYLKDSIAYANNIIRIYEDKNVLETDIYGNLKKQGTEFSIRKPNDMEKERLQAFRDYYWYGINMRTKDSAVEIAGHDISRNESLLAIKRWWTKNALALGVIQATGGWVAAKANGWVEGVKGQYYNSGSWYEAAKLGWKEAEKTLALGLFMDIYSDDLLTRKLNNHMPDDDSRLARVKHYFESSFTDRVYTDKFRRYVNDRLLMGIWKAESENRDNNLVVTLSLNYGIDSLNNLVRFKRDDFEKDGVTLKQSKKDAGYQRIYDIFQYDKDSGKPMFKGLNAKESEKLYIKFRQAVKGVKSRISGETSREEAAYANMTLVGNMAMHFRNWMPGVLRERFGQLSYDNNTLAASQGRYIATLKHLAADKDSTTVAAFVGSVASRLGRVLFEVSMIPQAIRYTQGKEMRFKVNADIVRNQYEVWKGNNPDLADKITFEDYLEVREAQLNAMIMELRVLLSFVALLSLLAMGTGGNDDDEYWRRKLYAVVRKGYSELAFTINPAEYNNMIKSPIPLQSIPVKMVKGLGNTFDEMRDYVFGENSPHDKTEFGHYFAPMLGMGYMNLGRILEFTDEDRTYLQN